MNNRIKVTVVPEPASHYDGTIADHLRQARGLIRAKKGWIKGRYMLVKHGWFDRPRIKFCLVGAIAEAKTGDAYNIRAIAPEIEAVGKAIGKQYPTVDGLLLWNDKPKRTHKEVLAALDKAIETCQAGEHDGAS